MSDITEDFFLKAIFILFAPLGAGLILFAFYVVFVWMPVQLYTEGECAKAGYPGATVTFSLKGYCNDTALKRLVPLDAQP